LITEALDQPLSAIHSASIKLIYQVSSTSRSYSFCSPFGHIWEVATHKKDMSKEELEAAAKEAFQKMGDNLRFAADK
jgi:hypothetical protein